MPKLSQEQQAKLAALKASVPAQCSWNEETYTGCWEPGRVYVDDEGDILFLKMGQSRSRIGVRQRLTFLGDGLRNVKGWGDREARAPHMPEVLVIVPVGV